MHEPAARDNFSMRYMILIVTLLCTPLFSCAGAKYARTMDVVDGGYYSGNPAAALAELNVTIEDEGNSDIRHLYQMERAVVHQRLNDYKASIDDLVAADEHLEIIDYTDDSWETALDFTVSPSMTKYLGQPHEKILLNTLNILNSLIVGALSDARIEARRAGSWYDYFKEQKSMADDYDYRNGLTMLLYGLVFDLSSDLNQAYQAYKEASHLMDADFLKPRLVHCARELSHSDLTQLKKEYGDLTPPVPDGHGTLLVVVMNGRSPIKVEKQITLNLPDMSRSYQGVPFSALGQNTIRYPEMVRRSHIFRSGRLYIGNRLAANLVQAVDIEGQTMARFDEERGGIIAACMTRLIGRSIIKYGANELMKSENEKKGKQLTEEEKMQKDLRELLWGSIGLILEALDEPDLRCWRFLPAEILVGLEPAPSGERIVKVEMFGPSAAPHTIEQKVDIKPGKLTVVQFFVSR